MSSAPYFLVYGIPARISRHPMGTTKVEKFIATRSIESFGVLPIWREEDGGGG